MLHWRRATQQGQAAVAIASHFGNLHHQYELLREYCQDMEAGKVDADKLDVLVRCSRCTRSLNEVAWPLHHRRYVYFLATDSHDLFLAATGALEAVSDVAGVSTVLRLHDFPAANWWMFVMCELEPVMPRNGVCIRTGHGTGECPRSWIRPLGLFEARQHDAGPCYPTCGADRHLGQRRGCQQNSHGAARRSTRRRSRVWRRRRWWWWWHDS